MHQYGRKAKNDNVMIRCSVKTNTVVHANFVFFFELLRAILFTLQLNLKVSYPINILNTFPTPTPAHHHHHHPFTSSADCRDKFSFAKYFPIAKCDSFFLFLFAACILVLHIIVFIFRFLI